MGYRERGWLGTSCYSCTSPHRNRLPYPLLVREEWGVEVKPTWRACNSLPCRSDTEESVAQALRRHHLRRSIASSYNDSILVRSLTLRASLLLASRRRGRALQRAERVHLRAQVHRYAPFSSRVFCVRIGMFEVVSLCMHVPRVPMSVRAGKPMGFVAQSLRSVAA